MWSCCMPGRYIPNSAFLMRDLAYLVGGISIQAETVHAEEARNDLESVIMTFAVHATKWPGIIHIPFCMQYSQLNHWNISGLQLDEGLKITGIMFCCIYFSHCMQNGLRNTKFECENRKEERIHPSDTVKCFYLPASQWSSTELLSQPDWLTVM